MENPIDKLIQTRHATHGSSKITFKLGMQLTELIITTSIKVSGTAPSHIFALVNIAGKMARIICGSKYSADHWDDIEGYAILGKKLHRINSTWKQK